MIFSGVLFFILGFFLFGKDYPCHPPGLGAYSLSCIQEGSLMVELWRAYQALGIKHEFYLAVYDQGMYCFETNALLFALLLQLSSLYYFWIVWVLS